MSSSEQSHVEVFRQEATELLGEVQECLLVVEEQPDNQDAINRLFRAMHSIKGAGGMFGYDRITSFTHHVETALDKVREGKLAITRKLIDLVLASHDCIREMLDDEASVAANRLLGIETALRELSGIVEYVAPSHPPAPLPKTTSNEGVYRIRFKPDKAIMRSGTDPLRLLDELATLGRIRVVCDISEVPAVVDMNPELCYLSWDILLTTEHGRNEIEDVFIFVQAESQLDIRLIDETGVDEPQVPKLGEILLERGDITHDDLHSVLNEVDPIGKRLVRKAVVEAHAVESALAEQEALRQQRMGRQQEASMATLRVNASKLDRLVNLVGELVTAQARISRIALQVDAPRELANVAEELESLTSGLRDETMSIRMVPIGSILGGFRRLVRDLSRELGKDVEFICAGEETELDKAVIERLKDPLVHILRNCVDHAIEKPAERIAVGKKGTGNVRVEAMYAGAHVLIRVCDDGRGINTDAVRRKAIERGLLAADAVRSDAEIHQLIFAPGFSTAEKVTEVSGRGVGMDVVRQNIEALRGAVTLESYTGQGTIITLKLPLTLAIIDGLLVTLDQDHFILPLSTVEECLDLDHADLEKIRGRNIINLRGDAVPFIRLREKLQCCSSPPQREQVVITNLDGKRTGVVVDTVIGSYQTVLKSLGPVMRKVKLVSGATILGDGSVALILDLQGIP